MRNLLSKILAFIKGNYQRFIWELVAVALGILATWLISQLTGNNQLQACQDERAELLRAASQSQSFKDSVRWSGVVQSITIEKDTKIKLLQRELDYLHEKGSLDSAAMLSELETMRAINKRFSRPR